MSSLAFDKQGKPFAFQRRTKKLLVRLFRNPSARGTCSQVLDADGEPLFIDPETDYLEFRKAVGQVPGLYRLDQCDEDGNQLDEAQPAYISIDVTRNAAPDTSGDISPLAIIQQLVATQADVMKTMASQQAALLAATAEILRAPYRPAPPAPPATELRNAEPPNAEDEEGDEDEHDETAPDTAFAQALRTIEPHLPRLGTFLYEKGAVLYQHIFSKGTAATAVASAASSAPVAHQPAGDAAVVASATSSPSVMPSTPVTPTMSPPHLASATDSPGVAPIGAAGASTSPDLAAPPLVATGGEAPSRNASAPTAARTSTSEPFVPTTEQFAQLCAIRARMTPQERDIVQNMLAQTEPALLGQWVAHLSAMTVEEALAAVRTMIADLPAPHGRTAR